MKKEQRNLGLNDEENKENCPPGTKEKENIKNVEEKDSSNSKISFLKKKLCPGRSPTNDKRTNNSTKEFFLKVQFYKQKRRKNLQMRNLQKRKLRKLQKS